MDIDYKKLEKSASEITLTLEPKDYEAKVKDAVRNVRRNMQMPGFRQGQVPKNIVLKKYGREILRDALFETGQEYISEYLEDFGIKHMVPPLASFHQDTRLEPTQSKTYQIIYRVAEVPDLQLDLDQIELPVLYEPELTDEDLETEARNMRYGQGEQEEVEVAISGGDAKYQIRARVFLSDEANNMLAVDAALPYLSEEVKSKVDEVPADAPDREARLADILPPFELETGFRSWVASEENKILLDRKKGDVFRTTWDEFTASIDARSLENPQFKDTFHLLKQLPFSVEILGIVKHTPLPDNLALFEKIFAPQNPNEAPPEPMDEEKGMDLLRQALESNLAIDAKKMYVDKVWQKLIGDADLDLPHDILMSYFQNQIQSQGFTQEQLQEMNFTAEYVNFVLSVLREAIIMRLQQEHEQFHVSPEDFENKRLARIRDSYANFGPSEQPDAEASQEDGDEVILETGLEDEDQDDDSAEDDESSEGSPEQQRAAMAEILKNMPDENLLEIVFQDKEPRSTRAYQEEFEAYKNERVVTFIEQNFQQPEIKTAPLSELRYILMGLNEGA